ncbi:molybdenum cofactor biosynthesis protein MoaE [Lysobacter sp. TY2-98]|uniref:molybdenum cofactor biosynthesis protein MoaE n=1 Tax=Lysobacter sp. TY2-98 TaxID=2290922 RepID=UPI000E208766|nr:molybdenum cofactor biosynthesis protein MoaE [Lysobacter sp. TY2-98]AXK73540.1 molybdenum cofactor biosynthesis protein MoaE [Lysobacter sp. TY2-98]
MGPVHLGVVDATTGPLDLAAAFEFVADPGFGGYNAFVGRIRDLNHGRRVAGVSYDMFDALAMQRFREIADEAIAAFGPDIWIWIEHAKGRLDVGGIAVVIAVGTRHRDEAFRACRQVIEAVKHTVPIWKQEHYEDGSSEWSEGCSLCHAE